MDKLQEMLSIYSILALLGIGLYMAIRQSKTLDQVSHLEREAKFVKVVGYIYIALGVAGGIILLI